MDQLLGTFDLKWIFLNSLAHFARNSETYDLQWTQKETSFDVVTWETSDLKKTFVTFQDFWTLSQMWCRYEKQEQQQQENIPWNYWNHFPTNI